MQWKDVGACVACRAADGDTLVLRPMLWCMLGSFGCGLLLPLPLLQAMHGTWAVTNRLPVSLRFMQVLGCCLSA
jgi:hypothetical protein